MVTHIRDVHRHRQLSQTITTSYNLVARQGVDVTKLPAPTVPPMRGVRVEALNCARSTPDELGLPVSAVLAAILTSQRQLLLAHSRDVCWLRLGANRDRRSMDYPRRPPSSSFSSRPAARGALDSALQLHTI